MSNHGERVPIMLDTKLFEGHSVLQCGWQPLKLPTLRAPHPFAVLAKGADFDFLNLRRPAAAS